MTRAELASAASLSDGQLTELESYGLVEPIDANAERPLFDEGALVVAQAAAKFMQFGIEPSSTCACTRRSPSASCNLFDQVVQPMRDRTGRGG